MQNETTQNPRELVFTLRCNTEQFRKDITEAAKIVETALSDLNAKLADKDCLKKLFEHFDNYTYKAPGELAELPTSICGIPIRVDPFARVPRFEEPKPTVYPKQHASPYTSPTYESLYGLLELAKQQPKPAWLMPYEDRLFCQKYIAYLRGEAIKPEIPESLTVAALAYCLHFKGTKLSDFI